MPDKRIFILGGTREARLLASILVGRGVDVVVSLVGATRKPAPSEGRIRVGGFGGAEGLLAYLNEENIDAVVDATHPFAARISRHATEAAARAEIPIVRLERPPWHEVPGDRWQGFAEVASAAAAIPKNARVLLTVGRKELAPFFDRPDIGGAARMIERPSIAVPPAWDILQARPPFTLAEELDLLDRKAIIILVAKNAGGDDTRAKIQAARARSIPVFMIERPRKPDAPTVTTPEAAAVVLAGVGRA